MNKLEKNKQTLFYKIIEKDIKHTYFKPNNGYLLINKSKYMPLAKVFNHLEENFSRYLSLTAKTSDNHLNLWGETYQLIINDDNCFSYFIDDKKIIINASENNKDELKKKVLVAEMTKYLQNNLNQFNEHLKRFNLKPVPIILKYLKSKFGSYHYLTNQIVLNIFLATLPAEYTDYVIYHEYAHQREKNHQKGFYKLLESICQDYKSCDQKLKKITIKI